MRSADGPPYVPAERCRRPPCRINAHAIAGILPELIEDLGQGTIWKPDAILNEMELVFGPRAPHYENVCDLLRNDRQVEETLM